MARDLRSDGKCHTHDFNLHNEFFILTLVSSESVRYIHCLSYRHYCFEISRKLNKLSEFTAKNFPKSNKIVQSREILGICSKNNINNRKYLNQHKCESCESVWIFDLMEVFWFGSFVYLKSKTNSLSLQFDRKVKINPIIRFYTKKYFRLVQLSAQSVTVIQSSVHGKFENI